MRIALKGIDIAIVRAALVGASPAFFQDAFECIKTAFWQFTDKRKYKNYKHINFIDRITRKSPKTWFECRAFVFRQVDLLWIIKQYQHLRGLNTLKKDQGLLRRLFL